MEDCEFSKWVDVLAKYLKEQRHGANVAVLIHYGPGGVEAMYSTPDAVVVEGMFKMATLALDSQIKSTLAVKRQEADIDEIFSKYKPKVN